ncbi:hypothetical protein BATDEDRAFT_21941 [Batrachochytrium dendrobatidis JAM81]|uniref:Uncharacterized protein n=1 Tax=Batrachochytrium dendrobatidis (strain JAM81 / FGSC 10211) TaxID=684364 RepID=F4NRG7_BATDJ|nr:uncharacterized protein BATDEDRAFT_21941 [Batrachochytrium dendrobatidis JAM81]EGF84157.1 hypothetical protein BATDEDRAFT_21941 [Batrachochytrium dendrobatidis JAM81]|eukprot:XP_006675423.1 hypothetical protein BATDEDRAFT_21941 [Batrachochytrium dendrobatidis JAM81]
MNSIENAVTSAFGQLQSQTNDIVVMMTKHDNVIRSLLGQILVKLDSGCSPTPVVVIPVVVLKTISTTVDITATVTVFCPQTRCTHTQTVDTECQATIDLFRNRAIVDINAIAVNAVSTGVEP